MGALGLDALAANELIEVGARHDGACRPDTPLLFLRIELVGSNEIRGVDFVLRQVLAGYQFEHIDPAGDLGPVNVTVIPVGRPIPTRDQVLRIDRTAIKECDFEGVRPVREVEHRNAALVPGLNHDVASRHRDE